MGEGKSEKPTVQTNPSLLRRLKDGNDSRAWSEFDALYRPLLARYAEIRGLSHADVEDVVQHCMTAVYMNADRFIYNPRRGRFKGWLRTLVNNRCRDLGRLRRSLGADARAFDDLPAAADSPETIFDRIWHEEHLAHCLRQIRPEIDESTYRAFHRYVLESHSVEDVCRELGLTPNRLYKIKHRLTNRLRELMREMLGEEADGAKRSKDCV